MTKEKKRVLAIDATNRFSQFVVDRLNQEYLALKHFIVNTCIALIYLFPRVSEAFINQKKIDAKVKQLNQNTQQFIKQSNQWIQLLENFNTALKASFQPIRRFLINSVSSSKFLFTKIILL